MEIIESKLYVKQAKTFLEVQKQFLETKSRILKNHHKNIKISKIQSSRIAEQKNGWKKSAIGKKKLPFYFEIKRQYIKSCHFKK